MIDDRKVTAETLKNHTMFGLLINFKMLTIMHEKCNMRVSLCYLLIISMLRLYISNLHFTRLERQCLTLNHKLKKEIVYSHNKIKVNEILKIEF